LCGAGQVTWQQMTRNGFDITKPIAILYSHNYCFTEKHEDNKNHKRKTRKNFGALAFICRLLTSFYTHFKDFNNPIEHYTSITIIFMGCTINEPEGY
jgi:hypothetical protein